MTNTIFWNWKSRYFENVFIHLTSLGEILQSGGSQSFGLILEGGLKMVFAYLCSWKFCKSNNNNNNNDTSPQGRETETQTLFRESGRHTV